MEKVKWHDARMIDEVSETLPVNVHTVMLPSVVTGKTPNRSAKGNDLYYIYSYIILNMCQHLKQIKRDRKTSRNKQMR